MKLKADNIDYPCYTLYLQEKTQLSEASIKVYSNSVNIFLRSDPDIDKIDPYNEFIVQRTHRKRSNFHYSALKHFIKYKIEDKSLQRHLLDNLVRPKIYEDVKRERVHLPNDALIKVILKLEEFKHQIISIIQHMTGVRAGDIMKLPEGAIEEEDYNGKACLRFNITGKGKKRNVVRIFDENAMQFIKHYINTIVPARLRPSGYYFLEFGTMKNRRGTLREFQKFYHMNYHWYWLDLKQSLESNNIDKDDFSTHDFRRCFARDFWEKYKDAYKLQMILNHKDPKTTFRYLRQSGLSTADSQRDFQDGRGL